MKFSEILKNDISNGTLTNNVSGTPAQGATGKKKKFSDILKSDIESGEIGSGVNTSEPKKPDVAEKQGAVVDKPLDLREDAAKRANGNVANLTQNGVNGLSGLLVSEYVPGEYNISKDEYIKKRQSAPDLPEFGSYEYFKNREEELRLILDEISKDADLTDSVYVGWAENYSKGELHTDNDFVVNIAKKTREKLKYRDAILAEYKDIDSQLKKYETQGVHYDSYGEIDAKSGVEEAKYSKERLDAILGATTFTGDEIALGTYGELPEEKQKEYDSVKVMMGQRNIEAEKEEAYNYYAKNKDNIYEDNPWGRITGNYEIGRIEIKANDAGYASFRATNKDIEAVEVYQALSDRIQSHNEATFQNNDIVENITAIVSQYAPQGAAQAMHKVAGKVLGAAIGLASGTDANTGSRVGGSVAVANYMYQQTAGAAFVRLLQESDLSAEDAKILAESEAIAAGVVEFGLDFATSKLWKEIGNTNVVKKTASGTIEKLTKALVSKGISEKGAKIIVGVAQNAGKLTLDALGEGTEEWVQEGMSITADRYAAEGKTASAYELFISSFDLTQYSKEDFDTMNQSFLAGTVIGYGHAGLNAVTSLGINKTASAAADAVDAKILGEEINKSGETQIVTEAVEMAKENTSPEVVKAVEIVETAIAEDKTPPAEAVGTVVKSVLTNATVQEATDKSVSTEPASELEEITGADEIVRFTPETAGDEIKRIETALITQGADDSSRREIVETALGFNPEAAEGGKTVRDVFAEALKLTSNTVANNKSAAEASGGYWRLLNENFKALAVDTQPTTSAEAPSAQVSAEATQEAAPAVEAAPSVVEEPTTGGIVNLKRVKNVYSLFKGAARSVVGKDVITDGYVAIPLTDEALKAVEKVAPGTVQNNPNASLEKFYNRGNDVVISGDPKIDDIKISGKTEKGYVFKMGDAYYSCQQKFIDAFNDGKNTITANKDVRVPWSVHKENGELVAVFMGAKHNMSDERFNSLQSVSEAKAAEAQQKAENAGKPFNQSELRQIFGGGTPYFTNIYGDTYIGEGHIFVRCDEVAVQFMKDEYRKQNSNSNYEIGQNDNIGTRVEKMFAEASELSDITGIAPYAGARKGEIAYPVGGSAMAFNKNYVNLIKKRSGAMKIVSNGTWGTTIIVGYDADGGITGFALPVFEKGEIATSDGKTVPFIKESDIKRLAEGASTIRTQSDNQVLKNDPNRGIIEEKGTAEQTGADNVSTKETKSNEKVTVQDAGGSGQSSQGSNEGTSSQNGDGPRVQSENGKSGGSIEGAFGTLERQRDLSDIPPRYPADAYIAPKLNSIEEYEAVTLQEYGIEWRVVKKQVWDRGELPAFVNNGAVYLREDIKEHKGRIAPHEATHVMRQIEYAPYLDFINRTPSMLNMGSDIARQLIAGCAEKIGVSLDAGSDQFQRVYDEINATIYGNHVGGDIVGEIRSQLEDAFYDFDAYISELQAIHEQFKQDNTGGVKDTTKNTTTSGDTAVNRDIASAIKETLRPEIASNSEFVNAMADRFGGGFEGLAKAIAEQYAETGTIGDFEVLFTDGGKGVYEALNESQSDSTKYALTLSPDAGTHKKRNDYLTESEDSINERAGNGLLSGSGGRDLDASAGKQAERISAYKRKLEGKTAAERKDYAKKLLEKGQTEEVIDGTHKYALVKPEGYNSDMLAIIEDAKSRGKEVGFFIGNAIRKFDGKREFKIDGIKISDSKILLRYDGEYTPQTLLVHEDAHADWNTPEMQDIKETILGGISDEEKAELRSVGRYKAYAELYKNNSDAVWEEFVADVLAGMNDYTPKFIGVIADYYFGERTIDRYSPREYNNIMDAGGVNAGRSNNSGIPDNNSIDTRYTFAGERANGANTSLLERAKEMLAHGADKETVFAETGWFKGEDGKWRFEIDDSASKFFFEKLKSGNEMTLADVFHNDSLYTAYPFLKDIKIKTVDYGNDSTEYGSYKVRDNLIELSDKVLNTASESNPSELYEETLLHEVQHAIQIYEGFELGGTPESMLEYLRQEVQYWLGDNDERFKQIVTNGTFRDIDDYVDNYIVKSFKAKSIKDAAFKAYRHLHGEKEADAVEKRFKLTSEERSKKYPDYGKGAILRNNENERTNQAVGISKAAERTPGSGLADKILADTGRRVEVGRRDGGRVLGNSRDTQFIPKEASFSIRETDAAGLTPEDNKHDVRYSISPDISDAEFWQSWLDKLKEYGTVPQGENPVRDVAVPKKISESEVISRFARTMLEAGITPDENVSDFEKAILAGEMTHEVITNKKAQNHAIDRIKELGFKDALRDWDGIARSGRISKDNFALGMELYNQCITNKDIHNAMKIAAELASEATRAGQTVQACRMIKLMTPDGQLYYLEKSIRRMNEEFKDKLGDKFKDIELDEKLMEEFLTEKDEDKRNAAYDKLCQSIADQIPATKLDKWNAWRYLAMLGNPRTHIRNIVGNAVFLPSIRIKNYVGAVIEKTARLKPVERTKSFRKTKEAVTFAKKDFEAMVKTLQGENAKYAVTSDIEGKRTIFKTKWLEFIRRKNFDFLEAEDMWFLKAHYVDALARLITVRGIDVNSITPEVLDTIRAYAVKEAQAATYRDANSLADGLNKLQRKLERADNKALRASSVLIEGVMPFKKTPMNIAKQGINYSPIGLLKGIYTAATKLKSGEATAADVIDDFSKGLTGTAIMLLGYFLASLGFIVGAEDKSKKEKEFDKMVGEQSYAFKIEDAFSYTIDWMTPSNLSLFIGVKLHDLTKDDFSFADIVDALSTVAEPLLELSVFSGVNDIIETAQYSDSEALLAIGSDMATSYVLQALPTVGGQLSRIIDQNKREYYYVDKNSIIPKGVQTFVGQAASKIPFASYLFEPAIDEWGREETYGNVVERAFENTISPGYYAEDNYTAIDRELKELYEKTGDSSVLPVSQQKYYKQDGIQYYMSAEDYTEVKKMRGQLSFKYVSALLNDEIVFDKQTVKYSSMSDDEKVKYISKCYTKAGDETKVAMLEKVKRGAK